MARRHELHAYDYVSSPYQTVCDTLLASPLTVFRQATIAGTNQRDEAIGAELHAHVGPLDVAAEVAIEILAIEEARSPNDQPATKMIIEWKAIHRPGLFPTMHATLLIYALTPTETQLDLAGAYDPPLGVIGDMIDAVAMGRLAEETVANFVRDVARFLRGLLSMDHAA